MKNKKSIIFGLFWLISSTCNADVNLIKNQPEVDFAAITFSEVEVKAKPKKAKPRSLKRKNKKPEIKQYEIEGYINKDYVRAVLEMESDKYVVGNIYDKSGKQTYVYGEYVDGALHVYDKKGKHFTIVVDKKK